MKKLLKLTMIAMLASGVAHASYDQKPLANTKGGTGSAIQTSNRVVITDTTGHLVSTFPTTDTELLYLHNVTSSIQTQINNKAGVGLNNLGFTGINADLFPSSTATINLGAGTLAFNNAYVVTIKDTTAVTSIDPINRHLHNGVGTKVLDYYGTSVDVTNLGLSGSVSGKTTLKTAATTTDHSVTLPSNVCGSGQYWSDNGSGVLSCTSVTSGTITVVDGGNTGYSIQSTDGLIRSGTTLTADRTYTLDACSSNIGERHVVKNLPSQTFNVIVDGNGSETIDGALTYTLTPGDSVTVVCAVSGAWDVE